MGKNRVYYTCRKDKEVIKMLNCELEWYEEEALREDAYMRAYFETYEDEDFEDFDDDVDESFYDPYMGCDCYE